MTQAERTVCYEAAMDEKAKDALEIATATGLALAGASPIAAAAIPGVLGLAWKRLQDRRVKKWWDLVVERTGTPEELSAKIEAGLAEEDENVVAGVVGGARAASSAIELSAVPVIAELSRRFLQEQDLPRWFYRGALELLERLEAAEMRALRQLFTEIRGIPSDSITVIGDTAGDRAWRAFPTSTPDAAQPLTPFLKPARLFGYMKRAGLGFDSGGYGIGGSPNVVVADREPVEWLCAALAGGLTS